MHWTSATRPAALILISIDPAMHFILRIDLTDHQHPGNQAAQHAKVRELLGLASHAVGANSGRKGDLTVPGFDPSSNTGGHVKVGSWKFEDETRNPDQEA
jgi:hypothetical protein